MDAAAAIHWGVPPQTPRVLHNVLRKMWANLSLGVVSGKKPIRGRSLARRETARQSAGSIYRTFVNPCAGLVQYVQHRLFGAHVLPSANDLADLSE